ncbi:blue (type 1) copper domain-containing protein [Haloterrigena salina JCM 13891]|uniref:Blue (Type 1) copper domain-containing protein n=1 Tax=Haloterrigena salina JCM 13891 TaxID=1227488 RepID=M0CRS4_9EURY|nr:plastocyanin/azurin family copper-binding protein [Haloterrigena salina]ELZ24559.1 blue (type 1) copper domain-containing protein [Haloterrigena salina JCM 13891]
MLELTGVAASTAFLAGCGGGGGNGNGGGNGGGSDGFEIDPGTTVEFSGQTTEWEGLAPSQIEGESNPTLILQEGEDYTIGWTEGDGSDHNIEIWDENGEIVNDLSTEIVSEPDEAQMLDLTASSEMAQYVCQPHSSQMVGDLQIEGGGGNGGNETEGNETGSNETGGNETEGNESGGNESGGNESSE